MAYEPFAPSGGDGEPDAKPVAPSSLEGAKGLYAMWCRAFRGTAITPPVLRAMELWEVGVELDGDLAPRGPLHVYATPPRPSGEKPSGLVLTESD